MSVDTGDDSDYAPYSNNQAPEWKPDKEKVREGELDERDKRRRTSIAEGQIKHNRLGWKRLTVYHPYLPSIRPRGIE